MPIFPAKHRIYAEFFMFSLAVFTERPFSALFGFSHHFSSTMVTPFSPSPNRPRRKEATPLQRFR